MISALIYFAIAVLIVWLVLYLISTIIPIPEPVKRIVWVVVILIALLWLVKHLGYI